MQQHVVEKISSEGNNLNRLTLKSKDLSDLSQLFVTDERSLPDPFFRSLNFCFRAVLFTKSQLDVINPNHPVIVHLYSTGAHIRNLGFRVQKSFQYYAIVYKANKSTVPLAQRITSLHDTSSITTLLSEYKAVVEESPKWPFKAFVTDWCWAAINSILRVMNDVDINQYLDKTYEYFLDKKRILSKMMCIFSAVMPI